MRKLIAIAGLLCGAASAQASNPSWCVKHTKDGVSLIKAPGIVYKLKHVRTDQVGSEESEVWSTEDGRLSIGFAEGDAYWFNVAGEDGAEPIADCERARPAPANADKMQTWCSGGGTVITQTGTNFMLKGSPVNIGTDEELPGSFFFDRELFFPCLLDRIVIKDQAVEVRVINPNYNTTNVQELAAKAWRSVNKEINIGGMTVKVRALTQEESRQFREDRKAQEKAARKEAKEEAIRRAESRESDGKATTYSYVVGSGDDCPNIETKACKPGLPCFARITIEGEAARLLYDSMRLQPRQINEAAGGYYVGTRNDAMICWDPQPDGQYICEIGYDAVANSLTFLDSCYPE